MRRGASRFRAESLDHDSYLWGSIERIETTNGSINCSFSDDYLLVRLALRKDVGIVVEYNGNRLSVKIPLTGSLSLVEHDRGATLKSIGSLSQILG